MIHGTTTSYYRRGCRCPDCRAAASRYAKAYRRRGREEKVDGVARITRPQSVPVEPVVAHLWTLVESGWRMTDIATEASIGRNYLWNIRAGARKRLLLATATRILALQPLEPVRIDEVVAQRLADGADWRTVRCTRDERLAAAEILRRRGWPLKHIDEHLGLRSGRDYARKDDVA